METVERKKPRRRRAFTPEFKADIVERCRRRVTAGRGRRGDHAEDHRYPRGVRRDLRVTADAPGAARGRGSCLREDRRYAGDVTSIATWQGWARLATVIDLASRRVVGWALADHMRTDLIQDALQMAFTNRRPAGGLIFHSDRGCQYPSGDFAVLARPNGVVLSVSGKGECRHNAVAESFFATIKRELIDGRTWPAREGLRRAVFDYIEGWYNTRRLHRSLGYLSPAACEAFHSHAARQAA